MRQQGNVYTIIFIGIISIICAGLLSFVSTNLKEKQEFNYTIEKKKNILLSLEILNKNEELASDKIVELYRENVEGIVINFKGKKISLASDMNVEDISFKKEIKKDVSLRRLPLFVYYENSEIRAYCIPITGKGLWSTIYGYLAFENDLNTIKGIVFYDHGETPGLGGEISSVWFQNSFKGKKIFTDDNIFISIKVGKDKAGISQRDSFHQVDGISGATMTSKAVEKILFDSLKMYGSFFKKNRGDF